MGLLPLSLSPRLSLPWFFSFDVSLALCTRRELKIKDERREAPRPKLDSCFLERTEKLVGWKLKVNVSSLSTKCRLHASRIRSWRRGSGEQGNEARAENGCQVERGSYHPRPHLNWFHLKKRAQRLQIRAQGAIIDFFKNRSCMSIKYLQRLVIRVFSSRKHAT